MGDDHHVSHPNRSVVRPAAIHHQRLGGACDIEVWQAMPLEPHYHPKGKNQELLNADRRQHSITPPSPGPTGSLGFSCPTTSQREHNLVSVGVVVRQQQGAGRQHNAE